MMCISNYKFWQGNPVTNGWTSVIFYNSLMPVSNQRIFKDMSLWPGSILLATDACKKYPRVIVRRAAEAVRALHTQDILWITQYRAKTMAAHWFIDRQICKKTMDHGHGKQYWIHAIIIYLLIIFFLSANCPERNKKTSDFLKSVVRFFYWNTSSTENTMREKHISYRTLKMSSTYWYFC